MFVCAGKDGKRLNMEAAAAALEAVDRDADEDDIAQLEATLEKETAKHTKANKGQGTAKGIGWEENGRRNGTLTSCPLYCMQSVLYL